MGGAIIGLGAVDVLQQKLEGVVLADVAAKLLLGLLARGDRGQVYGLHGADDEVVVHRIGLDAHIYHNELRHQLGMGGCKQHGRLAAHGVADEHGIGKPMLPEELEKVIGHGRIAMRIRMGRLSMVALIHKIDVMVVGKGLGEREPIVQRAEQPVQDDHGLSCTVVLIVEGNVLLVHGSMFLVWSRTHGTVTDILM
jgi:hypothetical protein